LKKTIIVVIGVALGITLVAAGLFMSGAFNGKSAGTSDQTSADTTSSGTETAAAASAETTQAETTQAETTQAETTPAETTPDPAKQQEQKIEETIQGMTVEEEAAQLFFITPEELTGVTTVVKAGEMTKSALEQYPVGGIVYFSKNIAGEEQLTEMIANTKSYSKVTPFIGVDEEGGSLVARIAKSGVISVPQVDDMSVIGASGDPSRAYDVGVTIGTYLSKLGFNMDFAPDADVLTNPNNTVIGSRSFGSDPAVVASMVAEEVKGLRSTGVSSALKHFPGHGGTTTDSHEDAAVVNGNLEELEAVELQPFVSGIAAGTDFVMAGHLRVPEVTGDDTPASLSSVMITDILRGKLGFNKIVITDAMNMGAVTNYYDSGQAAVMAIQAGDDMILMPENFQAAYQGVVEAVYDGSISKDRLDESVRRILSVKYAD